MSTAIENTARIRGRVVAEHPTFCFVRPVGGCRADDVFLHFSQVKKHPGPSRRAVFIRDQAVEFSVGQDGAGRRQALDAELFPSLSN